MSRSHKALLSLYSCAMLAGAAQGQILTTASPPEEPTLIRVLVVSSLETTLSAQMSGTIGPLNVGLGQTVDKEATLAEFNCTETSARAKVAHAELNMAKQNLVAKRNLQKLNAAGELEVSMAQTEVEKSEGALTLARAQSSYCQVQAPFAGKIAKVYIKPYQTLSAGSPMFDLINDSELKIRLNMPSSLLSQLQLGSPLMIDIHETGKTYPAKISAINARVDAVAQSVELEAKVENPASDLLPGMSGTARLMP